MTAEKLIIFGCEESYFFRGGTPFIAGENNFLASSFPPSCLVTQGAIRTAILNGHGADFQMYRDEKCNVCGTLARDCSVLRMVGKAGAWDDMELDFYGPFLVKRSKGAIERFYPAPYDLARLVDDTDDLKNERPAQVIGRLQPLKARMTDLGRVLLPAAPEGKRSQPFHGAWVSEEGLLTYLKGENIGHDQLEFPDDPANDGFKKTGFLKREQRIGIARQAATRNTEDGMYYAVEHFRLANDFALGERVRGLSDIDLPNYIKLGGEGRMTTLSVADSNPLPAKGIAEEITQNGPSLFNEYCFKITFLTPARFDGGWKPREFTQVLRQGLDGEELNVWQGKLEGIECTIVALCADRPERIGGWDLAKQCPKPRYSYLPAGSVIYLTSPHSGKEIVSAMHDRKLGLDTKIGFGQAVIGRW